MLGPCCPAARVTERLVADRLAAKQGCLQSVGAPGMPWARCLPGGIPREPARAERDYAPDRQR
jgi:hypothetical protein